MPGEYKHIQQYENDANVHRLNELIEGMKQAQGITTAKERKRLRMDKAAQ